MEERYEKLVGQMVIDNDIPQLVYRMIFILQFFEKILC